MNSRVVNLILLAVCLGLMGTLGFTLYLLRGHVPSAAPFSEVMVVTNTVTQKQIEVRKINVSNLLAALANRPWSWAAIESTNYKAFITNLQAFGCPEETIHDIILTDVAKLYARRRAALLAGQDFQYWRPQHFLDKHPGLSLEASEQLRQLETERDGLVKELLNVDFETEIGKYAGQGVEEQELMYGFLPAEKRADVALARRRCNQLREAVYARSQGLLLEHDEAELDQIGREEEQELGKLLTPTELQEYELRHSATAAGLRASLTAFEPTEQEFREIYRLTKTFDQTLQHAMEQEGLTDPDKKQRAEDQARAALGEELEKMLGQERYGEYVRAQDQDYASLVLLTERLNLPKKLAVRVYDMKQEAMRQTARIEANTNLTLEQRQRALLGISRETEKSVAAVLGESTFKAYRNSGAEWLADLRNLALETLLAEEEPAPPPLPPPVVLPPLPPFFPPPLPPPVP